MTEAVGYYVTVVREYGSPWSPVDGARNKHRPYRVGYLLGPFGSEPVAREHIPQARRLAEQVDPRTVFDAFGTASVTGGPLPIGVLNERAGL